MVQADSVKTRVESAQGFTNRNLKYDETLETFVSFFKLRHYDVEEEEEEDEEEDEDDRGSIDLDDTWQPPPKAIWDVVMEVGPGASTRPILSST
jgi:hypothetical protein